MHVSLVELDNDSERIKESLVKIDLNIHLNSAAVALFVYF